MSTILPLRDLKLRLSQVDYTLSAPCTHTLTPTQAVATHYTHTYVFTSLGIFQTLPCHTHSDIRTRKHTHTYTALITGSQSILNADTECSKNVQIDYTASSPCAHAHTYTGSCHALRTHIRLHIVRQQYSHMRTRTHTHIHATNHHQTKHLERRRRHVHNKMPSSSSGGPKCPCGKALASIRKWQTAAAWEARTCIWMGARHGTRSIKYDDLELAPNSWFDVVA